jgi:hypothetical protein
VSRPGLVGRARASLASLPVPLAIAGVLLLSAACSTYEPASDAESRPRGSTSATTASGPRPPQLDALSVADWPPFGGSSRIETRCSDDVGINRIVAHFKNSVPILTSGTDRSASFVGSDLGEGQGTLRIVCCDVNEACAERQITSFLVDLTPPEIEADRLVASPSGEDFDGDISLWVRDAWVLGSVELAFAGKTLRHDFPKAYPSTVGKDWDVSRVTFAAKDLPPGAGNAVITARDAAGNVTTKQLGIRVDGTAPVVSILAPGPGVVASGSSFRVRVQASDGDNPTPPTIDLWVGGARIAELAGPLAEIDVDTAALPPGPTEVRAIARDDAGNESVVAKRIVQVQ